MSKKGSIIGISAALIIAACTQAFAFLDFSGCNLALGRTHSIYDRGAWAGRWNPSLLARSGAPHLSMQFFSLGLLVGNNSLSRNDYNRLFAGEDTYWDEDDKEEILGEIPGDNLRGYLMGDITGFGFSMDRFAINLQVLGAGRIGIPKDFLTLALYGNELNREYSFDAIEGEGWGAMSTDFSLGYQLEWHFFDEFAVGGTFRYIYGLGYAGVTRADGGATVTTNGVTGSGDFEFGYGDTGDGVGLDLAASALWRDHWEFGITMGNLVGTIAWDLDSIKVYGFDITNGEIDIDSLDNEEYLGRLFDQEDTTYAAGTAKTRLPFYIQLNAGYRVNEKLIVVGEYQQGFSAKPGVSKNPRLAVGGEYRALPWLPVRTGLAVGGSFMFEWGAGFGLDFNHYTFDFGIIGLKGVFGSSHGIGIGFTNRIIF